jgi:signal transduction histidine kinase
MLGRLQTALERERRFVDDASHELRTPLANLQAELDLALRRSRTVDELEVALRSASEETERLARLAEDLLVLARATEGRLPTRREDVDVATLVREVVRAFASRAAERGVLLDERADGSTTSRIDPLRLRQALGNLLDNAIRHTPRDGRVTVALGRRDGAVVLSVTDTGPGFSDAFLAHPFEPFGRDDAPRGRPDGPGLGLAIVRAVAEAHGGSVEARNRAGGGAEVVLRLPA